jgi:hypothetical protein
MKLWTLPFRLLGILGLAAGLSGAWVLREDLWRALRPQVARLVDPRSAGMAPPGIDPGSRAHDKVDSLNGWRADSVVLSVSEVQVLILEGIPPQARAGLDSLAVQLGEARLTASARIETRRVPTAGLGPLAWALEPWERVTLTGSVADAGPGRAAWVVDGLTLRGFRLPEEASRRLVEAAVPTARGGVLVVTLPAGVNALRLHPDRAVLLRETPR